MLYDASQAPISWGSLFFGLPHLLLGSALLWATLRRKVWLQGLSGTAGLIVQALGGLVFFGVASWSIASDVRETANCRATLTRDQAYKVRGPLLIQKRFSKPGNGYVEFSIDNHDLRTATQGLDCDCGYIKPLGRSVTLVENQIVEAQVVGNTVLTLRRVE
jgi:hypothetical protein